ncbi:hypothetical protein Tco_0385134 [Tanacetum coccineum]
MPKTFTMARIFHHQKGNTIIHPHISLDEYVAVQKENKVRTLLLQALPEDHMPDFHHYDDARDIWMAVKASLWEIKNQENKVRPLLKQQFTEFSMTEKKSYTRVMTFSKSEPVESSAVCVKAAAAPTHSAFIGAASSGSKLTYSDSDLKPDQDMIYEFEKKGSTKDETTKSQPARFGQKEGLDATNDINEDILLGSAYHNAVKTLESQKDGNHKTQIALEEKTRVLSAKSRKTTTNTLSYTEKLHDQAQKRKERMGTSSSSITGTYMPIPYKSDIEETQVSYGSKSDNKTSETLSESNDFVSCDNSDKSSDSETYASCDSSLKTKTKDFPPAVDIKTLPESDVEDPNSTAGSPSFSCLENVKSPRILCNKSGMKIGMRYIRKRLMYISYAFLGRD